MKESWSSTERKKRSKDCSSPKGFTMKQFCRNQKTRSSPGERKNESLVRRLVSEILSEEALGIHGAGMAEPDLVKSLGHGGVQINKDGSVTDEEAEKIVKAIKEKNPERVFAYSRGAAALSKAVLDDEFESLPPVTYVAPAALRKWTDAPVPRVPGGSVTIIGDKDSAVPVKQACKVAKSSGTPLYVYPGLSHKSILYTKGEISGNAVELDVDACLSDDQLPDWGRESLGSEDQVTLQQQRVKELTKNESLVRNFVRSILSESSVPSNFASSVTHSAGWISPEGEYFYDPQKRDHGEWAAFQAEKDPKLMATFLELLKKETDPIPPPPPRTPAEQVVYDAKSDTGKRMDDWRRQGGRSLSGKSIPPYKNMEELYYSDIQSEVRFSAQRALLMNGWGKVSNAYGMELWNPSRSVIEAWMNLGMEAGSDPEMYHTIYGNKKTFAEGDWNQIERFMRSLS